MKKVGESKRFSEVKKTFKEMGFGQFIENKTKISISLGESPEKRLRKALEKLGYGFKLIGIYLAHRIDLIDPKYCKEFNKIRDTSIKTSFSEIEKTIINSYSRPVNTIFEKMWDKPEESTVLTQTHKAELTNGETVYVEVIKEKATKKVEEDIIIMKLLSQKKSLKIIEKIILEFEEHFKKKKNLTRKATFLKNSSKAYGGNYLPTPKEELCTKKVLILTYNKNKTSKRDISKTFEKELDVIKGEILILIIGVLIVLLNYWITKTPINIMGLAGLGLITLSFLISIKEKIKK